jgi:hypothetical protein
MRRALVIIAALAVVAGCARTAESPQETGSPSTTPIASATVSLGEPSPPIATETPSEQPEHPIVLGAGDDAPHLLARRGTGFIALGGNHVWVSEDGLAWDSSETSGLDGGVVRVVERGDETLLAFGYALGRSTAFRAWTSTNGRNWQSTDLGMPRALIFLDIARGERGYVLVARALRSGASPEQLWFSNDAVKWELVYSTSDDESIAAAAAGPEGFVAVGQHGFRTGPPQGFVLASADGREWIRAAAGAVLVGAGSLWSVVPLHGDWVTSPLAVGAELPILWSPNGLDWEERASLPIELSDVGVLASLMSNGSRLFAAVADGGGRPLKSNLLTSLDGIAWSQTEVPLTDRRLFASSGGVDLFLVGDAVHIYRE